MNHFDSHQRLLLRQSRFMKQQEAALKMGFSKARYSELERKDCITKKMELRILKTLGYTVVSAKKYLDGLPPPPRKRFIKLIDMLFTRYHIAKHH